MEQPREPKLYPNEEISVYAIGSKNGELYAVGKKDNTLQSIDSTLKRIEQLLIQLQSQFSALGGQVPFQSMSEENSTG